MGINKLILSLVCSEKKYLTQLNHIGIIVRDFDAYDKEATEERDLEPPRHVQMAFNEAGITLKVMGCCLEHIYGGHLADDQRL